MLIGSAAEYGMSGERVTEETPTDPRSDYGRAKNVLTATARQAHRGGADVLVLRPFNIVAPELPVTNALGNLRTQAMACGTGDSCVVRCGRLDVVRDFVTADFVAEAVVRGLTVEPTIPVLNVASGEGIVLHDLFDAVGRALGLRFDYRPDPQLVAIPAPDRMIGDPSALEAATGLRCLVDPQILALALIGADGSGAAPAEAI